MSRLRRIAQHSRFFFVTTNLRPGVQNFCELEFALLAESLAGIRSEHLVSLCGYCFMPDHLHVIIFPHEPASLSRLMQRFKLASFQRVKRHRGSARPIWQSRFYDRALRTRGEFDDALDYMHMNPIRNNLAPESVRWSWSSARWFAAGEGPIEIDHVNLPFNRRDRI